MLMAAHDVTFEEAPRKICVVLICVFKPDEDNDLYDDQARSPEKNGTRWWILSEDLCDPDQADTKAAELDAAVVMLR